MKKFVIGDIHGSYRQLDNLLNKISPDLCKDKLIFLGDYIDRGPESYRVIKLLMSLQENFGKNHVVLLRGNHEQMAINNIYSGFRGTSNGYSATLRDFEKNGEKIEDYLEFFSSLLLCHEDDNYIYVHGGIRPGISLDNQNKNDLLWIRGEFYNSPETFKKPVIFGHTPTVYLTGGWTPFIRKDRIGIDTGCVFDGHLTALEIVNGNIIEIHSSENLAA